MDAQNVRNLIIENVSKDTAAGVGNNKNVFIFWYV